LSRVLVVCEDAGGARALEPVVARLTARREQLRFVLGPVAARTFAERGLPGHLPCQDADAAERALAEPTDLLLAATSCWGMRLEAHAVIGARARGVPSLGLIDFPSNLAERLSYPGARDLGALPDLVAATDAAMQRAVAALGVDERRIVVTGSPAMDELFRACAPAHDPASDRLLFLSQPLAALYGADASAPGWLGYSERTVLEALAAAAAEAGMQLTVRPHPREDSTELARIAARLPTPAEVDGSGSLRAAIGRVAVVAGMSSIALVEAALMGAPVISAQLERRGDDPLAGAAALFSATVTEPAKLAAAIASARVPVDPARREAALGAIGLRPGAAARVVAAVDRLLARHPYATANERSTHD
jgi:hypothetical protein